MPGKLHEFDADEVDAAVAHITELPPNFTRVNVEVWDDGDWRFVFGNSRDKAPRLLPTLTHGRRFRVQGVRLTDG
jgi:hypothetical protein